MGAADNAETSSVCPITWIKSVENHWACVRENEAHTPLSKGPRFSSEVHVTQETRKEAH